jgi:hypothetical protein
MIKHELTIDVAMKGKVVKVIEVPDMLWKFTKHQFHKDTIQIINECVWEDVELDYCGG